MWFYLYFSPAILFLLQCLSNNKKATLTEIVDVLRSVCHAHRLPLALTWLPCCYTEGSRGEVTRIRTKGCHSTISGKNILCLEESACYITDRALAGFVRACTEHHIEEGKGIAGKALRSNHPFFCPDVKAYDISEYPLVHHARKYNLNAAVAIRLRSTYTNHDDYILEFFLPVNMRGGLEQQLLLDNLSGTMQRICSSLRTVSDAELSRIDSSQQGFEMKNAPYFPPLSCQNSGVPLINGDYHSVPMMPSTPTNAGGNEIEPSANQVRMLFFGRNKCILLSCKFCNSTFLLMSKFANNFPHEMISHLMCIISLFKVFNLHKFLVILNQEDCIRLQD